MLYHLCRVRETSPGTHTFFHTYTCPVYCWRSVQLLDFSLSSGLIHASQPVRDFCSSGQCFASGFLQTPPHDDALASGCILPTAGRIRDSHPLERAPARRTRKAAPQYPIRLMTRCFFLSSLHHKPCTRKSCQQEADQIDQRGSGSAGIRKGCAGRIFD